MEQILVIKQITAMSKASIKQLFSFFLFLCLLSASSFSASAQTVVTNETFPNQFNTAFGTSNNSNGTFVGSSGTWTASCNSNALSAIAVIPVYYAPVNSNAIKVVNWNTTGLGAADCHAASPTVNLSTYSCAPSLNLTFQLYTYTCSSSDPNSFLKVEFSADNGSTWTSVWSMSSAQIFAAYGASGLTTVTVGITASYRVANFKYRFSGYKPANESHNFYQFIDDAKITATACSGTGSIGDRVWLDADGDGIQDASETGGITGVTVQLKNSVGTVIATTNTNATGNYLFSGLAAGNYTVVFPVSISGAVVTTQNVGSDDNIDSDPSQATGATGTIVLAAGQNITNVDAGYCPTTLQIGNRVWNDANNNGIDGSEAGISGATVNLYKDDNNDNVADGAAIATTTTNATGNYTFSNLAPGNYIVGVVTPAGFTSSAINGGDPDNNTDLDDNGQVVSGTEIRGLAITLVAGTEPNGDVNNTYDFGFYNASATGSIGDRVWLDADGDGIQDASETGGITGVTVQLKNSVGTVIATTNTNATGNYLFSGLAAGNYTVVFPVSISGAVVTTQNVGSDDNIDSDPSQATGATGTIVLAAGQNITNVDAGYCPVNLQLGNKVWYDTNNDGLNNASENGIRNVTVNLYKDDNNDNVADGASIATLVTDANGNYTFSNLAPGNYIIGAIIPNGYLSSSINGGDPDNNIDLDDNGQVLVGNEIRGLAITLTGGAEPSGNTNNTYDLGLLPDCNCTTSAGNLLVNASFENGTTGWSWSAANGSLTTGTGYVACGAANGFNNWSAGTSKVWQDVTMAAGSTVTFSAFAGTHTAGISCSPKLSLIFLNSANAVISQTDVSVTRDVDINYSQLARYSITAIAPANTVKVRVQSSITCNTMKIDAFCLTASASGSIGDFVWEDLNRNGLQDNAEPGIGGVTVILNSSAGSATTTTAANGAYIFSNLPAGTYTVTFTTPAAYVSTLADAGSNDAIDSDPVNGVVSNIVLAAGEVKNTVDAGFYRLINISGHVWNDANGLTDLQINQTGAQAIPNSLNIYLVDVATGLIVQTEAINLDGTYSFLDVDVNHSYKIVLSTIFALPGQASPIPFLPSGWQRVGENLGAGPLSGHDGVPNGILFIDTESSDVIDANFGIRLKTGEIVIG